jgi:hypothetical protein
MKRIFISFEVNRTGILHAKRTKTEANIPFLANVLFVLLQSEYFEAK